MGTCLTCERPIYHDDAISQMSSEGSIHYNCAVPTWYEPPPCNWEPSPEAGFRGWQQRRNTR